MALCVASNRLSGFPLGTLAFVTLIDIEKISFSSLVSEALNRHVGLEFVSKGLVGNLWQGEDYLKFK